MEIILSFVALILGSVVVIAYDRYKYRRYYNKVKHSKETFVFLRANNAYIRKRLKEEGFNVCFCAHSYSNNYLYACLDHSLICGFNESQMHLIDDAKKKGSKMVDCAKNLNAFIEELKKLEL